MRQPSTEIEQLSLSATTADFRLPSRILVTGNAGSGKSTLTRQLRGALSLPTYGLDAILWQPGWRAPAAHERERLLAELAGRSRWVIIWNFNGTARPAILSRARDANATALYSHVCNELDRADVIRRLQVRASAPGQDVAA